MENLRKNWTFILVAGISLALGVLVLMTTMRLRSEKPVAPTAPTKQLAVEGIPAPQCQLSFNIVLPPSPTPDLPTPTPTPAVATPTPTPVATASPTPTPTASPSATPTSTPTVAPTVTVIKTADRSSVNAGDLVNYTIKVTNTGSVPAYDAFFEENLSAYVTYQAPSMSCTKTVSGQTSSVSFEIDNLADGLDETPDGESANLKIFRIAGDLTEANNTWDLPSNGDYIQCSYRVRVNDGVAAGTNMTNTVVAKADNKDGNQPSETEANDTDSRTIVMNVPAQCNMGCSASSQCPSNLTCYIAPGQTTGNCRTPSCPTDSDCSCPQSTPTPTPVVTSIPQVPRAGNSLPTILLVGAGALLLILGFAL